LKKKKIVIIVILVIAVISICIVFLTTNNREITPNGNLAYNHVTLVIDETNLYEYIGAVDYVFVGTVMECVENITDDDFPDTIYSLSVNENLKGNLVETIEVKKHGGYTKNGTLILYETDLIQDSGLPEVGKQYIFLAYGQPDGSLLLDVVNGNVEYSDTAKEEYQNYIANQIEIDRNRSKSQYEAN